jgi:hypothetical protein
MLGESENASSLKETVEAEACNLEMSLNLFGDSIGVVEEVDGVYGLLTGYCESLKPTILESHPDIVCILMLFFRCRIQLKLGIITLLRCHWADSLMYLRKAAESCAIAARMRQHPHLAQIWLHAAHDTAHYKKFKEKFTRLFPEDDDLLRAVFEVYDYASKILHGSPLSLKGHVAVKRTSPTSLDLDYNAFDVKYKDQFAASLFYHLTSHKAILRVFGRVLTNGDVAATRGFEAAMRSLETKLEAQRLCWQDEFPEGDGW